MPARAGAAAAPRTLGRHDTPPPTVLKVLGPLLLDELWSARAAARGDGAALRALQEGLSALRFLDPACGRGRFLGTAFVELRRLARTVAADRRALGDRAAAPVVAPSQFHGIEVDPAAAADAETLGGAAPSGGARIVCADALELAWASVLPPTACTAVMGNPPFVGKQHRTAAQAAALRRVFGDAPGHGELDHAAAWLELAARYVAGTCARVGFVATSSLVQGEQVAALWPRLLARGMRIDFAERPFPWTCDGAGAAVSVVVVGFSGGGARREKRLDGRRVRRISPYLAEGPDLVVRPRRRPLAGAPPMRFGSMPNDGGHLLLGAEERGAILARDPLAAGRVRELLGARELMGGERRWCLWLPDASTEEIAASPVLRARTDAVRRHRAASGRAETRRLAAAPGRFGEIRQPAEPYLCVPRHGAAARRCPPMAFASPQVIAHDSTLTVAGAGLELFGLLQSAMFTAWLRGVAGRLKGDPRISAELVYNTFPWPPAGDAGAVEAAAAAVLAARARHAPLPLDRLYDPAAMPAGLARAHDALDAAVDARYGRGGLDEPARLGLLLERYEELAAAPPDACNADASFFGARTSHASVSSSRSSARSTAGSRRSTDAWPR